MYGYKVGYGAKPPSCSNNLLTHYNNMDTDGQLLPLTTKVLPGHHRVGQMPVPNKLLNTEMLLQKEQFTLHRTIIMMKTLETKMTMMICVM